MKPNLIPLKLTHIPSFIVILQRRRILFNKKKFPFEVWKAYAHYKKQVWSESVSYVIGNSLQIKNVPFSFFSRLIQSCLISIILIFCLLIYQFFRSFIPTQLFFHNSVYSCSIQPFSIRPLAHVLYFPGLSSLVSSRLVLSLNAFYSSLQYFIFCSTTHLFCFFLHFLNFFLFPGAYASKGRVLFIPTCIRPGGDLQTALHR